MKKKILYCLSSAIAILVIMVTGCAPAQQSTTPTNSTASATPTTPQYSLQLAKTRFKIATTTSLYDTGLWAYLEPMFEEQFKDYQTSEGGIPRQGIELDIVYAGTGAAINQGKSGNVDAVIVHDPDQEKTFVSDNYGVNKRSFAYNFFMLAGPVSDPAGVKDLDPAAAFKKLAEAGAADPSKVKFVSRGDNSGTHGAEKRLWAVAGYDYATQIQKQPWYVEAGQGMAPTLVMSNEMNAYVLCDGSTFTVLKKNLSLIALVKKNAVETLNVYNAYSINATKVKGVKSDISKLFINWLISPDVQKVIGEYGVKEFGGSLFYPIDDPTFQAIPNLKENMQPVP